MTKANLDRPVLIFFSKDGVFQFARKGTKDHQKFLKIGYLPAASVATLKDAERLQLATCKLSYDGAALYRFPMATTLDGLDQAGTALEVLYQHWKAGLPGWPDRWVNLSQEAAK